MQFTCLVGQHSFTSQHRERKAQAKGGSVVSRQTGDMEATSTVRTQASDTVDIIRETPDCGYSRSASYKVRLWRVAGARQAAAEPALQICGHRLARGALVVKCTLLTIYTRGYSQQPRHPCMSLS